MLSLLKFLDIPWERARTFLKLDLEAIQSAINQRWAATFGDANVLPASSGGIGALTPFVVGDLLTANTTTTLSKIADVAVGSVLISGGVGVKPLWSANPTITTLNFPLLTNLSEDGADILAHKRGTSTQEVRIYNTFTSVSNNEYVTLGWKAAANVCQIATKANGAGVLRRLRLGTGTIFWDILGTADTGTQGDIRPATDASQSIGQQGSAIKAIFMSSTLSWSNGASTFARIYSTVDAKLVLNDSTLVTGVGLDFTTDALLKIRKSDFTGNAKLSAGVDAIAGTSTDGLTIANDTLSTSGAAVQQSPRIRFRSHVWNTTAVAADNTDDWWIQIVPVSSGTPVSTLQWARSLNGAAATFPFTINSAGNVTLSGTLVTTGNVTIPAGNAFLWQGRVILASPADGQFNIDNNTITAGVGIDVTTDSTLKIRNRAQNADGSLTALNITASATLAAVAGNFSGAVSTTQISLPNTGGAASCGQTTLVTGTKTVNTTRATATCLIFFQRVSTGGTIGFATTYTVNAGTSFTINSDSALDTSVYNWMIIETH